VTFFLLWNLEVFKSDVFTIFLGKLLKLFVQMINAGIPLKKGIYLSVNFPLLWKRNVKDHNPDTCFCCPLDQCLSDGKSHKSYQGCWLEIRTCRFIIAICVNENRIYFWILIILGTTISIQLRVEVNIFFIFISKLYRPPCFFRTCIIAIVTLSIAQTFKQSESFHSPILHFSN
jgi:hypothetical protein